jgi:uncharacterized cupredoxin-like copper-binding protein
MKMPGKVRSMIDEMEGLSSPDKAKLVRHLNDMADSLPEHPSPAEASRIVKGAMKQLEIKVGKKEKAEEPKEEPKKEKKEAVKESVGSSKLTFKAFLSELKTGVEFDANLSMKAAQKVQALLDTRFKSYFTHSQNKDGSVTFKQTGGTMDHDEGNSYVLSPQNLSKLIGDTMTKFRKLGWTFTQPVSREFIIGVPEGENLANMGTLSEGVKKTVTGDEVVAAAKKFFTPQGFDDASEYRRNIEMNLVKRGGAYKKDAFDRNDIVKLFNDIDLELYANDFCKDMGLA